MIYLISYITLKGFAYSIWCYVALNFFFNNKKHLIISAAGFGLIRLLIGIFIGQFAILKLIGVIAPSNQILDYFLIFPVVRLFEWLFLYFLMNCFYKKTLIINTYQLAGWILGGIIISCLADIPVFIALKDL